MLLPLPETETSAYEQLLRAVLKSTADAIVLKDIHGKVLMVNPAGVRLAGVEDEDALIGRDMAELFDARTAAQIAATDRQVIDTGVELTYEMPGGLHEPSKTYLVTTTPWRFETGRLVGLVSVAKDITERKRAEEATRVHARKLETLLAVASHDLREPLRAMGALTEILRDDYGPRMDDEGRDLLERILRGTHRMEDLIDGVSLFMRAHRLAIASRTIDGGAAVAEALRRVEPEIARVRASVSVNGPFPSIRADKGWVVEVLFHLLANALKFTASGHPPVVEIAAWNPRAAGAVLGSACDGNAVNGANGPSPVRFGDVRFGVAGPMDEVGFVVRDRGPGVSVDCHEKIFSLFRRAVGRDVPGIGVGLAIVREVAERHRGRAFVQARDGGGSEFIVTFGA